MEMGENGKVGIIRRGGGIYDATDTAWMVQKMAFER